VTGSRPNGDPPPTTEIAGHVGYWNVKLALQEPKSEGAPDSGLKLSWETILAGVALPVLRVSAGRQPRRDGRADVRGGGGLGRRRELPPGAGVLRKPSTGLDGKPKARVPVAGYLIARTGDSVLVAEDTRTFDDETAWRIDVVPRDQIETMIVGPPCVVEPGKIAFARALSAELERSEDPALNEQSRPAGRRKLLSACSPEPEAD
jgi:hypothetical protein